MRTAVIGLLLLVSGWANALTLSPMIKDELVYSDLYLATHKLSNTSQNLMYYDVWVTKGEKSYDSGDAIYKSSEVLGGNSYKSITVPIMDVAPDKLGVYYLCVQEKPEKGKLLVVGRVCAKLRLYWPLAELRKLQ